jgi:hypothetical protein
MSSNDDFERREDMKELCSRIKAVEDKVAMIDDDFTSLERSVLRDFTEINKVMSAVSVKLGESTLWKRLAVIFMGISGSLATLVLAGALAGTGAFGVATNSDINEHDKKPFHDVAEVQFLRNQQDIAELKDVTQKTANDVSDIKATLDHAFPESATRNADRGNSP